MIDAKNYKYHVFLSYRRAEEWPDWVGQKFLPLFKAWLGEELGETASVFFDQQFIEAGSIWPRELSHAIARSCVLVPLLTKQYFNSKWCMSEWAHMCAREDVCRSENIHHPKSLIIPAILHDGEDFPKDTSAIASTNLQECAMLRLAKNSPKEEELERRIKELLVPNVAKALKDVPSYDPRWEELAVSKFMQLFKSTAPEQKVLPSLGVV